MALLVVLMLLDVLMCGGGLAVMLGLMLVLCK